MKALKMLRGLSTTSSAWLLFLLCLIDSYCFVSTVAVVKETTGENNTTLVAVNVGLIYDDDSWIGKMGFNCIHVALSDFYSSHAHYNTRILLHTRPYPKDSVIGAAEAALYLLKYLEVKAIVGPTTSTEAKFVIHLGEKAQVPIISFSATSPFISSLQSPYFIRAAQNDSLQAQPICALVQAFGWREVVPVYVDDDYGAGLMPYLADALQQIDVRIPYHWAIPLSATDDQLYEGLYGLKTQQTRVFVVHMALELASRLFLRVNEVGMMDEGYVWITTTGIGNDLGSLDHSVIESMQGVVGLKTHVPRTNELKDFNLRWDQRFPDMKLNVMGLWAYDAALALARGVEEVGARKMISGFINKKNTSANLTDLDTLGVSPVGPHLLQAMANAKFRGLAGNFSLIDGQLESSTYQIMNVIGSGIRELGFWTPQSGLLRKLNSSKVTPNSVPTPNAKLKLPVMWPGETMMTPKGWTIPTAGKKLRVGVPVKAVYEELVKVTRNETTGTPTTSGFCIEVFDAVMESLPYYVPYEYQPYAKPDGTPAGTYDDLVQQVFFQNYDIVVGDITIIANRTQYVDFTLPYTESGVIMVVPVKKEKPKSAWVFLKPLTWELWVATLCVFIFIAFVIWVLEHRINEEFRGPPSHQAGTSLFYSFSMTVFAQRENVLSNLARFVVIIWVFVVLVLTQSYTASLTSMLTVQQLQPTVTDANELLSKGASVGVQEGTFVKGFLIGMGFHESRLISYNSSQNLHNLLSKGSANGGISAVFDEIPYMRIFLAAYPSKYTMVQPTYKTAGFGFGFPIGSPLVPEVSRAILRVTEGDKLQSVEKAWGMQQYNDSDKNTVDSSSLGLDSFWGLFLVAGLGSGCAVFIFMITFLYEHRHIWTRSHASIRTKIQDLATAFDQRDMESHTFKKNIETPLADIPITPNAESPPRLSSYSDQTEENLAISPGLTHGLNDNSN